MDKIAVLDFGGQYAHLIANRVRRAGVYSEILPGDVDSQKLLEYKGIILSGGPASLRDPDSIKCDPRLFELGIPVLGICYGHQLIALTLGGNVESGKVREYGPAVVNFENKKDVFEGVQDHETVWMSHFDQVTGLPDGFENVGKTDETPIAAMADFEKNIYSMQFHPEVTHTPCGSMLLDNFINLTRAKREWDIDSYIDDITEEIKQKVGDKKVFLMISGGVDSTVAFLLLVKALGQDRVYGLFVDTGFMRAEERIEVESSLKKIGVTNLHVYDAGKEYFEALKEIYDPEQKRQIIGDLFLEIQAKVSGELKLNPEEWFLAQGTIYPDTIETGGTKHADKIKTHHNQVEAIKKLKEAGRIIEPLEYLYKDEVRVLGEKLNLEPSMVWRHPFPGPGLAVRTLCAEKESYPENVTEIEKKINEYLLEKGAKAKILPIKSVGVQGDARTYKNPLVVYGKDFSWDELDSLATRLTNQFEEVNRVVWGLYPQSFEGLTIQKSYLTKDRISTIQKADKIVMDYLLEAKINMDIWQFPTVLLPIRLGSQLGEAIVLRPVCSQEAMTANFYKMPSHLLSELLNRLKKIDGVNSVFYDITNKPPGTIEWE
jgi:GMP synthase (glutamine-hydrolysing)